MSQPNVERVIGRLMTDEGFRRRFGTSAVETLRQLVAQGVELNDCEWRALVAIDPRRVEQFARSLEPCIQKVDLEGGHS
jgi:hypothetical protein